MQFIENRTFDEIEIGDSATLKRTLSAEDIELFAILSGDVNPTHVDAEYARGGTFHEVVGHNMWSGALISSLLGTELPGPGTVYVSQRLDFHKPLKLGAEVEVRVTVTGKDAARHRVSLDCVCLDAAGERLIDGAAEVVAPTEKIRRARATLPEIHLHAKNARFHALIAATRGLPAARTAVVHPCDALSLGGALEAATQGIIVPVLVGPRAKIEAAADGIGASLDGVEIVDAPHSHAAAQRAVELVRKGDASILMKGKLHTDELMEAVVDHTSGLRTERRMSHVFALDAPHYPKVLFVTDAAVNIAPGLDAKRDIVQNAIDLVHALGVPLPKVALLSAVETVTTKIPSTVEAAALCKMLDRGQITGGLLDGPLAFDNAVSKSAAEAKGIESQVAGDVDILVAPDLEAGNMIAKQLVYLAGAVAAGIILGARAPIVLTSRADGVMSRLASCAMARLFTARQPEDAA